MSTVLFMRASENAGPSLVIYPIDHRNRIDHKKGGHIIDDVSWAHLLSSRYLIFEHQMADMCLLDAG
jgi:hypothetical protein